MALSNVEEAVLGRARGEADKILQTAKQVAERRKERESGRLREQHKHGVEAARAELEGVLEREASASQTRDRLELLKLKNEIIEEVFTKALDGIISLPDDGYRKWLKSQLECLPPMEDAKIVTKDRDKDTVGQILEETNSGSGFKLSDETVRIRGGFLVQGRQVDLDYSVESLLRDLRESLAQQVAARLFGEEKE